MNESSFKNNMEETIKKIYKKKNYKSIINSIIKSNLEFCRNDFLNCIMINFESVFDIKFSTILLYFERDENIKADDFENYTNDFLEAIEFINELKEKYSFVVKKLLSQNRQPFLLNSTQININKESTDFTINITRTDGETFSALLDGESLLNMVNTLLNSTNVIINIERLTANIKTVEEYFKQSKMVTDSLNRILQGVN